MSAILSLAACQRGGTPTSFTKEASAATNGNVPVDSVAAFNDGEHVAPTELTGATPEQLQAELDETYGADHLARALQEADQAVAGRVLLIEIHKSFPPYKQPEVLQTFWLENGEKTPANIFDGNRNEILCSSAGTYNGHVYSTPAGTFHVQEMEVMHHSSKYHNAPMPYSIFFNGGIAVHGATPDEYRYLGHKASHGCVRVHPDSAAVIYKQVLEIGRRNVVIKVINPGT